MVFYRVIIAVYIGIETTRIAYVSTIHIPLRKAAGSRSIISRTEIIIAGLGVIVFAAVKERVIISRISKYISESVIAVIGARVYRPNVRIGQKQNAAVRVMAVIIQGRAGYARHKVKPIIIASIRSAGAFKNKLSAAPYIFAAFRNRARRIISKLCLPQSARMVCISIPSSLRLRFISISGLFVRHYYINNNVYISNCQQICACIFHFNFICFTLSAKKLRPGP